MKPKGQHVQDNSVAERRLRPIYDWLDNGSNKKALQECDKVLKKTPNLLCAKALKALTLYRMGKEVDCAAILEDLALKQPTDDATLQAMTLCYRELQQPEKICGLYETAVKLEPINEELCTHLFMSYVRTCDFKSQQKTAMTLYKNKPKNPYYCWAVMSLILQATRGEGRNDPTKRGLLLKLAERMMVKLIDDNKIDAEQEVQLYIMVLDLLEKYEEILGIFSGPLNAKLVCYDTIGNQIKYLIKLQRWTDVNLLCKNCLVDCIDRWNYWTKYIDSVIKLMARERNGEKQDNQLNETNTIEIDDTPEKCHEFICGIIENNAGDQRGPYLARFRLCEELAGIKYETRDLFGATIELFVEYFRKFGHKSWCVADLRNFLHLLDNNEKSELSTKLVKEVGISSTSVPQNKDQMQRHMCALQISRICGGHRNLPPDHLRALVTAFSLHYQHGYQSYDINLLPTDSGCCGTYALLAAHVLFDLSRVEQSSNPIIVALILLDNVMKNSPSYFHAKLLSIRLYHTIGAVLGAHMVYNNLDCKHVQLDSLGYLHCVRLASTGLYSACGNLFDATLNFFSSNYKDSLDHITLTYKYGSFVKVEEFMDFRETLNNSLHYTAVAVDRIFLNLMECASVENLYSMNISPKDGEVDWDALMNNYDFALFEHWDYDGGENRSAIDLLFEHDLNYVRLRTFVIVAVSAAVDVAASSDGERNKHIDRLLSIMNDWGRFLEEIRNRNYIAHRQDRVALPLPSRLFVTLKCPHFEIIGNLLELFIKFASNKNDCDILIDKINSNLGEMLDSCGSLLEENNKDLRKRREVLEFIVNNVEILCMSVLICVLCNEIFKSSAQVGRRSKKKLTSDSKWQEKMGRVETTLRRGIELVSDSIKNWGSACTLDDLCTMLDLLNLNVGARNVYDYITNSYLNVSKELYLVLRNKLKLLTNGGC